MNRLPDQRALRDQVYDLVALANQRGMYDAADWIARMWTGISLAPPDTQEDEK